MRYNVFVNTKNSQLENLPEDQKEMIRGFDDETIIKIYQSRKVALEYAKKGIHQTDSEKSPEEIADYMQFLARTVLEKRGLLGEG